jgi:hypothetical protein
LTPAGEVVIEAIVRRHRPRSADYVEFEPSDLITRLQTAVEAPSAKIAHAPGSRPLLKFYEEASTAAPTWKSGD